MHPRRSRLVLSMVALCGLVIGCSSSDDGRVAELEGQLDMEKAVRMTAEQERDTAKAGQAAAEAAQMAAEQAQDAAEAARRIAEQERDAAKAAQMTAQQAQTAAEAAQTAAEQAQAASEAARVMAEQERDAAKAAQMMAERAQAASEAARMAAEQARTTAEATRMTAEQASAGTQFDAAVANAVERVTVEGLRHEINPDDGRPHGTSGWISDARAYADQGSEFAVVSQSHAHGDRTVMAVPWRDQNGDLQWTAYWDHVRNPLSRDGVIVYAWSEILTDTPDRDGVTTSHKPIRSHGLGEEWQGFELTKAYDGHGTRRVRLFADFAASDVLAELNDQDISGYYDYEHRILLSDYRVPGNPTGPPGRDGLYISIPGDGLQGSLDGVAGTFSCAGDYCSLLTTGDYSAYVPWTDSQAVRFTPADGGAEVMLDPAQVVRPSTEVPKVNYLAFGSWEEVPEDATQVGGYDFGVFAGGDDPYMTASLPALSGTASYAGKAAGTYVETIRPRTDTFTADASLMADFGSPGELGRVTGTVSGFQLESGSPMPVSALSLQTTWDWENNLWAPNNIRTSWDHDDNLIPGGLIEGETVADGGWWGLWSGKFFGNGADGPAGHPSSFAGTFGATDGTRSIAGSFGAHKQ